MDQKHNQNTQNNSKNKICSKIKLCKSYTKIPRDYQTQSFEYAKNGNTIINLDTGLGKTLIACLLISNELKKHNGNISKQLIIFLAPQVPLVEQQARVISHEVPAAIVRKLHGQMHLSHREWTSSEWKLYLNKGGNVFVMTPSIFHNMLIHGHIHMNYISLIIFDECHHITGRDEYRLIMQYHYRRYLISERPKIFGMTAPLIKGTSSINNINKKVSELSFILNSSIYKAVKSSDINIYNIKPNISYVTYSSYLIDPEKYENIWPNDPGLNEERWEREQDHFYRVLNELGERAAVIALNIFIKTDEKNIYLHRFPMEKIAHDSLLKKEFQIECDYQNKKKILKKNWYYFKKKYLNKNKKQNIIYNNDLKQIDNDDKPIVIKSLLNDNQSPQTINDNQSHTITTLNIFKNKPKYQSKSSRNKEKKNVKKNAKVSNREKLEKWIEILNNQRAVDSELQYYSLSPKCIVLLNILLNELDRVGSNHFKTLILVKRRKVAQILSILINQSPLPILADFLISSISKGGAMNAKICPSEQKDRLSRFHVLNNNKNNNYNCDKIDVLVATSLLEEGLDVPSCKLVIKFNETVSSKQDVQCQGRARHSNSRYIHLICNLDEQRQTNKLKNYKKFQKNVEIVSAKPISSTSSAKNNNKNNKKDKKDNDNPFNINDNYVLNPKTYSRGLYVESTKAFIMEQVSLTKLHEIYNRFDDTLNCDVPWESFALSPFSKQNFEQFTIDGICGTWKVNKALNCLINDVCNDNYRLTIRRKFKSDYMMEGTFYITNDLYQKQLKEYIIKNKKYRRNKYHKRNKNQNNNYINRTKSPQLPDIFANIQIIYYKQNHNKIKINIINNDKYKDVCFYGTISKDRNNIKFYNDDNDNKNNNDDIVMELDKLERVTQLNTDPNAYACDYKLILKLRNIPQSFVNYKTQKEITQKWVNDKLDMQIVANILGITTDSIQRKLNIQTDTAISFMLCLWKKPIKDNANDNDKDKDNDDNNQNKKDKQKLLIKTNEMLKTFQKQITSHKCNWDELDTDFFNNLMDQFRDIFGGSAKIMINTTNPQLLSITTHVFPHYIRNRNLENDIPPWIKQKCRNLSFGKNADYEYSFTSFQEFFQQKRSIRIDFSISGIRLEKTEFQQRLDLLRQELTKKFKEIHLFIPGQSNWKRSNKNNGKNNNKKSLYTYDKLYQYKLILPKLSEFYNNLPQTEIIGDIRFHFKSARDSVAFKAVKFLYSNHILDDNFCVYGRRKAPRPMAMMATKCDPMTMIQSGIPATVKSQINNFIDQLHCIKFINESNNQILYKWGILLTLKIEKTINFYIYPTDIHWINNIRNIGISSKNKQNIKWKVSIEWIGEYDRVSNLKKNRLSYHTNLMSLLGYNENLNYNCSHKNCVIVPLNKLNNNINISRINYISRNPWSEFVNVIIMFLWGKQLTINMIKSNKSNLIKLLIKDLYGSRNNDDDNSKCRIELIEEINELPCVAPSTAKKWNINKDTTIIMIKFVASIHKNDKDKLIIPDNPSATSTWANPGTTTTNDNKKKNKPLILSTAEAVQRTGFHIRLEPTELKSMLKYPSNDLRFIINHRDEAMIQSHTWPSLTTFILNNNQNKDNNDNDNDIKDNDNDNCDDINNLVVKMNSTDSYYTELNPTSLHLKSQIGAGFSYLDWVNKIRQNNNNLNDDDNSDNDQKIDENELLYQGTPLPLRPEDATIKNKTKLKKIASQKMLLSPQMCHIVPVEKEELFFSRYLCCSLWKLEKLLLTNDFAKELQKYVDIEYNNYLLFQCISLPSIDMILHNYIGRIYFFGDQIIKYCASIEAYSTKWQYNEVELTRFVHHTVSNDNLCNSAKSLKYLKYLNTQPFDAKKYEITNFAAIDDNDEHRVSRKSIADMIEGLATATFYNNYIQYKYSNEIIEEPFGGLNLSKMIIGDNDAIASCREFIIHLLGFTYYEQPVFPQIDKLISSSAIKCCWNNKLVFTVDDGLKNILNCLQKLIQTFNEEKDDDNLIDGIANIHTDKDNNQNQNQDNDDNKDKINEFEWTDDFDEICLLLGLNKNSSSRDIEDKMFEIHDNCMQNTWDLENLKILKIINQFREYAKNREKLELKNREKNYQNPIIYKNLYLQNQNNGLNSIIEEDNDIKYDIKDNINNNKNKKQKTLFIAASSKIIIPACINHDLGNKLYKYIMKWYNMHCITSKHPFTAELLDWALYKSLSSIFVCEYDKNDYLILYYRNKFTQNDIQEVINKFNILCDDLFPIFALYDKNRINLIEKIMNYSWNNMYLIFAATTHSAFNISSSEYCNYQRLEFIGDASIGIVVSQYLFQTFTSFQEGRLSHSRAALVCNHYLARKLVRRFHKYNLNIRKCISIISSKDRNDIDNYINNFEYNKNDFIYCLDLLTISKEKQPYCAKILADIYEALIGAILIDTNGNLEIVWDIIKDDFILNDNDIITVNKKYAASQILHDQLTKVLTN